TGLRPSPADTVLDRALRRFVAFRNGPPGIAVVVHRGDEVRFHTAGVADVVTGARPQLDDHMRLASVAKAFSGAAALAVVADGKLSLDSTIGDRLPALPTAWSKVTLRQALNHTSGLPDFSQSSAFREALFASLLVAPPPIELLSYVADEPLEFRPGSRYQYSNSDNIVVGLMIEAATGQPYEQVLRERVYNPLGLTRTSLPRGPEMPTPYIHGYEVAPLKDVSELFAAGWSWASGGVVSTPRDADRFVRGYVAGATTDAATRAEQLRFVTGGQSEPPGPGQNAAGLGIFRYQTTCGTVYGHTGNTAGYTQFVAANADGTRSTTVSINAQITPKDDRAAFTFLRSIFSLAVCAALAK
ncbi:MAG: beta-lactamase family protein, partial [Actinomycetota bacterium]|nr:beta-lactamase family protein [Actinomycetota bacterium]